MQDPTDNLSPLARTILKRDAGTAYARLLIDGSAGNPAALPDLQSAEPRALCAGFVTNPDEARGMLAGLWLWHDYLDESHRICQALETPTGALWHAILHRREGDFSNSKYWYAQAADHPALPIMAAQAGPILNPLPADKRLLKINYGGWSGPALVDLVQSVHRDPADALHPVAVALQQLEWRVLFDHGARAAQG